MVMAIPNLRKTASSSTLLYGSDYLQVPYLRIRRYLQGALYMNETLFASTVPTDKAVDLQAFFLNSLCRYCILYKVKSMDFPASGQNCSNGKKRAYGAQKVLQCLRWSVLRCLGVLW
ncbi:hypothetical protein AVEN_188868-1 [Araneus ventricosus]|uniref:Uncharacterized protein n=1 Tax=Araneus ventricosus TaxID=182803 RepID=A0A4Y2VIG7_ARAVE|nr:hypothetical protein AVEN_188868-1 [Araneus ventricosus]